MNYLGSAITSAIEVLLILFIISSITGRKLTFLRTCLGILLVMVFNIIIVELISSPGLSHIIFVAIAFFITKGVFNSEWKEYLLAFALGSIILTIVELLIIGIVYIFTGVYEADFLRMIIYESIGGLVIYLLKRFVPMYILWDFVLAQNKWFLTLVINIYGIFSVTTLLWYLDIDGVLESIVGIMIFTLMIIGLNVVVINNGLVNQSNQEKLLIYETYIPIIDDIIDEVRTKQHDYHNHIQTLSSLYENQLAMNQDQGSLLCKEYLQTITKKDVWNDLIRLESKVVMAFYYSKYKLAMQQGIDLRFNITALQTSRYYNDYELVEMYGILLDNAIEGTLGYLGKFKKDIMVKLYRLEEFFYFEICNSSNYKSSEDIKNMFIHRYSTKKNKGGYGLTKLRELSGRHGGKVLAEYDIKNERMCIRLKHK